jgi:hypothetical protein
MAPGRPGGLRHRPGRGGFGRHPGAGADPLTGRSISQVKIVSALRKAGRERNRELKAAEIVSVGADQIGEQLGVAGVGFGPRGGVAVAAAADCQRVHCVDLVPGREQRLDQTSHRSSRPPHQPAGAGIVEDGDWAEYDAGTPQGATASPQLAKV